MSVEVWLGFGLVVVIVTLLVLGERDEEDEGVRKLQDRKRQDWGA